MNMQKSLVISTVPQNHQSKKITDNNNNVLFDIDWQGSEQLSKFKELNLVKVFILPPSKEELEKRLIARNQDDKEDKKENACIFKRY